MHNNEHKHNTIHLFKSNNKQGRQHVSRQMQQRPMRDILRAELNSCKRLEQIKLSKIENNSKNNTMKVSCNNDCLVLLSTWRGFVVAQTDSYIDDLLAHGKLDQEPVAARSPLKLGRSYVRLLGCCSPESLHAGKGTVPALITFPSQTSCRGVIHHDYKSARCWKPTVPPAACERHRRSPCHQSPWAVTFTQQVMEVDGAKPNCCCCCCFL